MNEDFKLSIDDDNQKIVLNNSIFINDGSMSYTIKKETNPTTLSDSITIKGVLSTNYYIQDLETIETPRYYLTGINVIKESYGSKENLIIYEFECESATVKYQVNSIEEEMEEDNGK